MRRNQPNSAPFALRPLRDSFTSYAVTLSTLKYNSIEVCWKNKVSDKPTVLASWVLILINIKIFICGSAALCPLREQMH